MDSLVIKPRNKEEFAFVNQLLQRLDIRVKVVNEEKEQKKKAKKQFLDSLPGRLKEVELHMQGKIELPTWDEIKNDL